MDAWRSFKGNNWKKKIDVRDFINLNFMPYLGDALFLQKPTSRTLDVLGEVTNLLAEESRRGGVLDVDTEHVSSILAYDTGYIDKDKDIILGLQTDSPLKRAVNPFA
ncbi:MAG: pyruvate formate lyase family protein, partial [Clostridia bacterium]